MFHEQGIIGPHDNGDRFAPPRARWHRKKDMYKQLGSPLYLDGVVNHKLTLHGDSIKSEQLAEVALRGNGFNEGNADVTGYTFDALVEFATKDIEDHLRLHVEADKATEALLNIEKVRDSGTGLAKRDKVQNAHDEALAELEKAQKVLRDNDEILGEYNPRLRDPHRHKNDVLESAKPKPKLLGRLFGSGRK